MEDKMYWLSSETYFQLLPYFYPYLSLWENSLFEI